MPTVTRTLTPKLGIALLLSAGIVLAVAPPVIAAPLPLQVTGFRSGGGVAGYAPVEGTIITIDPTESYPTYTSVPTGWEAVSATANLYHGETADGTDLNLYCIEIRLEFGINYFAENWLTSEVPNLGYVTRILAGNYPAVPDVPAGFPLDADRIMIVQAAIWYFTDGFVLNAGHTHRDEVEDIVNATLAAGPLGEPDTTEELLLTLNGPTGTFESGDTVGPFSVTSTVPSLPFTVQVSSGVVSSAADGTGVIPPGSDIPIGTDFWVTPSTAGPLTVTVRSENPIVSGLVFGSPDVFPRGNAQTLVTAATAYDVATASATVRPAGLADTGVETAGAAAAAATLVVVGVGMLAALRRRRTA